MKKKGTVVLAFVAALALVAIAYLWSPGSVPAGQKPLLVLSSTNLSEFEKAFDDNPDVPRLLLLVSPT
jgi:hypothetical protein